MEKLKIDAYTPKRKKVNISTTAILFIALAIIFLIFSLLSKEFYGITNLISMLQNISFIGIVAVGMSLALLGADADLSVGANAGLTGIVMAIVYSKGVNIWICLLIGLSVGALIGAINGVITTGTGIHPLVTTIGMLGILQGLSLTFTNGQSVLLQDKVLKFIGNGKVGNIPFPVILVILFFIVFYFLVNKTKYGRRVQIIGLNPKAALLAGIKVQKIRTLNYIIVGICASVAGIILSGMTGVGMVQNGEGMQMIVLTAVFLGGASLYGGKANILGTFAGVLIMSAIHNGLTMMNMSYFVVRLVRGIIIIFVVAIYESRDKKRY